jgi:hypothetical protein
MIELSATHIFGYGKNDIFHIIDDVHKLSGIKKEIKNYTIARDEHGLQIIDTVYKILFFKNPCRLKYTAIPDRYTELKQIKGSFKLYECRYELDALSGSKGETGLTIKLRVILPYGPLGYIFSLFCKPILQGRIQKELQLIDKLLSKQQNTNVKTTDSPKR